MILMNRFLSTAGLPLLLLTAGLMLHGCGAAEEEPGRPNPDEVESEQIRPVVMFAETDDEPLHHYVETQGTVEPLNEIELQNRQAGQIDRHQIRDGSRVTAGDTLLSLEDEEWRLNLEEAREEYEQVAAEFRIERNERLRSMNTDSLPPDLLQRLQTQTGYTIRRIRMERARLELDRAHIEAPFTGQVQTDRNLSPGQYLGAGTELGRLVDHSQVRVRFDLLESEIGRVEEGMAVELTGPGGYTTEGTVESISPVVDPESKTGQVVAHFDNPDRRLRAGMTVDGRILAERADGRVRAPREAMLERDQRHLVFKLHDDDTVEWIYVDPIAVTSDWIILNEEALDPGDHVAVDQHFAISHQQQVDPRFQ